MGCGAGKLLALHVRDNPTMWTQQQFEFTGANNSRDATMGNVHISADCI